jgi:hypothetical protein
MPPPVDTERMASRLMLDWPQGDQAVGKAGRAGKGCRLFGMSGRARNRDGFFYRGANYFVSFDDNH